MISPKKLWEQRRYWAKRELEERLGTVREAPRRKLKPLRVVKPEDDGK